MDKKMKTTIMGSRDYMGLYRDYRGLYWGYTGQMKKNMETFITGCIRTTIRIHPFISSMTKGK